MKKSLYFLAASYFGFFARLKLKQWQPRVFVVTGSSGKTTTLHLLQAQFGDRAHYSHKANSAFGIPFDILGLQRKTFQRIEWLRLIVMAPFAVLTKKYPEDIYIVEVDCDRPHEGEFLAELLRPEAIIWLSSTQTHAKNFDLLVGDQYGTVEEVIGHEFGNLLAASSKLVIVDADNAVIASQLVRSHAKKIELTDEHIGLYKPGLRSTSFELDGEECSVPALLPREVALSVLAVKKLAEYVDIEFDSDFMHFQLPPGRSSVFAGKKDTTLIDSTYNASLDAAEAMIATFDTLKAEHKWLVISDILEQGRSESAVHERLAKAISHVKADKIILMGPRTGRYTAPKLDELHVQYIAVDGPKQVLDIIKRNIKGGETILFKGTRFLEGVVERYLASPEDASKLCRRETVWVKRRKKFGI